MPTIYFKGLDNLDCHRTKQQSGSMFGFSGLLPVKRDYGDKEAALVMNTVGNIFSGQVVCETAKILSERFGKVLQIRQTIVRYPF